MKCDITSFIDSRSISKTNNLIFCWEERTWDIWKRRQS